MHILAVLITFSCTLCTRRVATAAKVAGRSSLSAATTAHLLFTPSLAQVPPQMNLATVFVLGRCGVCVRVCVCVMRQLHYKF